jgi:Arc/MetJ family transcription regulator
MRTNIVIDDDLISEAQGLSGLQTKRATVEAALRLLVDILRQGDILDLVGKVEFAPDYDYKALRRGSVGDPH